MPENLDRRLDAAAGAIAAADALLITAGAGIGVDSGLPDFRGDEGFWRAYPPLREVGVSFVDMANPSWFQRDPPLAWGFYGHRLNLYRLTEPHPGFGILRRWADGRPHGSFVFTSNVDGQFQSAGFAVERVLECHGSIHHLQCAVPCVDAIWDADGTDVTVDETSFRAAPPLPRCPHCGSTSRPNVLMFGDWCWIPSRTRGQEQAYEGWLRQLAGARLAVVEVGAGMAVLTVRMMSERAAARLGGTLIRINPREPQTPSGGIGLELGALEALRAIDRRLQ